MKNISELSALLPNMFPSDSAIRLAEKQNALSYIRTIKKSITRWLTTGEINEKLLINNIIFILNCYGTRDATRIIHMSTNKEQFAVAKAVLIFLNQYNEKIGWNVEPHRVMVDMLSDTATRFNLTHVNM